MSDIMKIRTVSAPILGALALCAIMSGGCGYKADANRSVTAVIPVPTPMAVSAVSAATPGKSITASGQQCPDMAGVPAGGVCPAGFGAKSGGSGPLPKMDAGATMPLTPQPALDAQIALFQSRHATPKDIAALYVQRGTLRMMDPQASPHLKYPAALRDFHTALKLDPGNRTATGSAGLIEEIYRGLGKAVPTN